MWFYWNIQYVHLNHICQRIKRHLAHQVCYLVKIIKVSISIRIFFCHSTDVNNATQHSMYLASKTFAKLLSFSSKNHVLCLTAASVFVVSHIRTHRFIQPISLTCIRSKCHHTHCKMMNTSVPAIQEQRYQNYCKFPQDHHDPS